MALTNMQDKKIEDVIEHKYVAFCDVLGFSDGVTDRFEETIETYRALMRGHADFPIPEGVEITIYSDSILMVSKELLPIISAVNLFWFQALMHDCLLRGGIAYGRHWSETSNGNLLVVSEALVKAVKIEKTIRHPAVALSSDISVHSALWLAALEHKNLGTLIHYEGLNCVSPFNVYWFQSGRHRVEQMKERWPQFSEKYDWFLKIAEILDSGRTLVPKHAIDELVREGVLVKRTEGAETSEDDVWVYGSE